MEKGDSFLMAAVFGGDAIESQLDPVNPSISVLPPEDPITKFARDREFELALQKTGGALGSDSSWDEPLAASVPLGKRFTNPLNFAKGTIGFKLGIVRQERKTGIDGDVWLHGYNEAGELVDARVMEFGGRVCD